MVPFNFIMDWIMFRERINTAKIRYDAYEEFYGFLKCGYSLGEFSRPIAKWIVMERYLK